MKLERFLIRLSLMSILAVFSSMVEAEQTRAPQIPPEVPIKYWNYDTEELEELIEVLGRFHRHAEVVEAGNEALRRSLTQEQDAFVRLKMANSYEFVQEAGSLAKEKYGEILELHPNYEQNITIAMRLGQLNDHIIIPNTERNVPRALECFKYVINNYDDPNTDTFYLEVMQTHIHLGDIYALLRNYDKSNMHYDRIYNCDPNQVVPLPYRTFESQEDLEDHKTWLIDRILLLKDKVRCNLVNNCIRTDPEMSINELEKVKDKYADDPVIVESADEALGRLWNEMFNVERVVEEFLHEH